MRSEDQTTRDRDDADMAWRPGRLLLCALGALAALLVVMLISAVAAPPAEALPDLNPLHLLPDAGDVASSAASDAFQSIFEHLFPSVERFIDRNFVTLFTTIGDPFSHQPNLKTLQGRISTIALSITGVVVTLGVARYFMADMLGGGGAAGIEALAKAALAIVLIASWPWIYRGVMLPIANAVPADILGAAGGASGIARSLANISLGLNFAPGGWIIAILMQLGLVLMLMALLAMRVMLQAGTTLGFVAMPLALALLPVTDGPARQLGRAIVTMLAVPTVWALLFAVVAAIGSDNLTIEGLGDGAFSPMNSLAALVLFAGMVFLPWKLAKMTMLNGRAAPGIVGSGVGRKVFEKSAVTHAQNALPGAVTGKRGAAAPPPASPPRGGLQAGPDALSRTAAAGAGQAAGGSAAHGVARRAAVVAATAGATVATGGAGAPAAAGAAGKMAPAAASGAPQATGQAAGAAQTANGAGTAGQASGAAPVSTAPQAGAQPGAVPVPSGASAAGHPSPSPQVSDQRAAMRDAFDRGDGDRGREAAARAMSELRSSTDNDTRYAMAGEAMKRLDPPALASVQRAAEMKSPEVRQSALIEEVARASERGQPDVAQALVTLGAADKTTLREQVSIYSGADAATSVGAVAPPQPSAPSAGGTAPSASSGPQPLAPAPSPKQASTPPVAPPGRPEDADRS